MCGFAKNHRILLFYPPWGCSALPRTCNTLNVIAQQHKSMSRAVADMRKELVLTVRAHTAEGRRRNRSNPLPITMICSNDNNSNAYSNTLSLLYKRFKEGLHFPSKQNHTKANISWIPWFIKPSPDQV